MKLNNLPDDVLRSIASRLSNTDASMLSMASKDFRKMIKNTHPNLPIKPPSYAQGTGRYQAQFQEVIDAAESEDRIKDTDLPLFFAILSTTHDMEVMMRQGRGIRFLKATRSYSKHYKRFYKKVKDRLTQWKGQRYKNALKVLQKRTIRDEDDSIHATAVFDAVVMVGVETLRSMLL